MRSVVDGDAGDHAGRPDTRLRMGVSLLTNIGLANLIAESTEDYLRIAIELASDPTRLHNLHSTLRRRMEQSPLMDAPRFARNIEAAYRQMWRTWCEA